MSNCDDPMKVLDKKITELIDALVHLRNNLDNKSVGSDSIDSEKGASPVTTSETCDTIRRISSRASLPFHETRPHATELTGSATGDASRRITVKAVRLQPPCGDEITGQFINKEQMP